MTDQSPTRNLSADQSEIPTFRIDTAEVQESFLAYAALIKANQLNPALSANEGFVALQSATYAQFLAKFEAI